MVERVTIRVGLNHRTTYTFAEPVKVYPHTVRLRPAPHCRTPITAYSLNISPAEHFINWQQDPFGNWLARLVFPERVKELEIVVDLVADLTVINPFDFFVEDYAENFPFDYAPALKSDLAAYLAPVDEHEGSGPGPVVQQWMRDHGFDPDQPREPQRIVDFLVAVNGALYRDIDYSIRMEAGVQTPDHTLTARLGSCRDSAWLLVSILRQLGLAARFVSGYLVQLAPDIVPVEGDAGPTADFTDLHAWTEVFVPGAGWIGLDPTSGLFAGEGHIPLSATPHPSNSAPISGATDPVTVEFGFANSVTRVHEDPRVTAPYSDEQWAAVDALGAHVDELLAAGDVRLTMGGEPTFVADRNVDSPQWSTAADGEQKRAMALQLAARLAKRWAPQGIVQFGQGKWYPGEELPRWQIQLSWRTDGQPMWTNSELLDTPWGEPVIEPGSVAANDKTQALAAGIAGGLGVPSDNVLPGYTDPFERAWAEARRPEGVPPELLDPDSLATVAQRRGFVDEADAAEDAAGQALPRCWVIPLFEHAESGGWGTTRWSTRRRHLFLTPGTSPAGLRLPLSSLSYVPPPEDIEPSRFELRGELPAPEAAPVEQVAVLPIDEAPRHALVVEERDGHVHVFLPPLHDLDRAVRLLSVIEAAAAGAGIPVVLEGYSLPGDARVQSLSVTPDPGVIEVNVQPTSNWADLRELTETLYDDARHVRLTTEKFDVDGTHTGTGGGNHFTLGGRTPADSPLLRRPDLLRSMITFWQHHPALSYVFSGRFIGPTSQAPRVDEGRHETLYELEIAFAELDRLSARSAAIAAAANETNAPDPEYLTPPWLVDRLLRNLLTDLVGNTHRSEFCIDKMYAPGAERGRLGLLELRGFEMPPHPKMALVQALLVRALVARFWDEPYTGPLVRWGSRLHDRFLLPTFAMDDLHDVVDELNNYLAPAYFDPAWFAPFAEFRFPRLGGVQVAGVSLTLRMGVEPWNVLGEEASQSGTSRYVDSSVERVEVSADGLNPARHVVTCNGIPVPLVAAPRGGAMVGGVRYRAWSPPSALHPTIDVQSPLVFDLVDRWSGRSLGGFTYHVVHPGGRSYEDHPVNAAAAETRRASRFQASGHTPGPVDMSRWPSDAELRGGPGAEYPTTLDLRRFHHLLT